jgi:hypothetical protein
LQVTFLSDDHCIQRVWWLFKLCKLFSNCFWLCCRCSTLARGSVACNSLCVPSRSLPLERNYIHLSLLYMYSPTCVFQGVLILQFIQPIPPSLYSLSILILLLI